MSRSAAVSAHQLNHGVNKRVEAAVAVGLSFSELLYAGAQAPVGFLQVVCERHIHLNELAYIRGERLKLPRMGFNHLF